MLVWGICLQNHEDLSWELFQSTQKALALILCFPTGLTRLPVCEKSNLKLIKSLSSPLRLALSGSRSSRSAETWHCLVWWHLTFDPFNPHFTDSQVTDPSGWDLQLYYSHPGHPCSAQVAVSGPESVRGSVHAAAERHQPTANGTFGWSVDVTNARGM